MTTYIIEANKNTRNFYYTEFKDTKNEHNEDSVKELYDKNTGFDTQVTVKFR